MLEIGCHSGTSTNMLFDAAGRSGHVVGVDIGVCVSHASLLTPCVSRVSLLPHAYVLSPRQVLRPQRGPDTCWLKVQISQCSWRFR